LFASEPRLLIRAASYGEIGNKIDSEGSIKGRRKAKDVRPDRISEALSEEIAKILHKS